MANLNDVFTLLIALWRIWMPIMNFWLPYGDSEWLFFFFGCPMAILNDYFALLAALWRFRMTSLNFWLPYSEIEWTIYTLACTKCEIGRENLYFHHSSDKSGLKVTDCTVQSAKYWCFYGTCNNFFQTKSQIDFFFFFFFFFFDIL